MKKQNSGALISPGYIFEISQIYPHRTEANTPQTVCNEMQKLIADGTETIDNLRSTIFRDLMNKYFPMASEWVVMDAFDILKGEPNTPANFILTGGR
jgi:hypothetical protein